MHLPPPPDSRELLPPLLACLPTAFISPRPPPALLPLLSPLLRQRLSFLATGGGNSRTEGWLPLLSWNAEYAAKLPDLVERMHLEPHPVSGEVEIDDVRPAKYRRLDEETLHARLDVEQFDISSTYLWCENDEHGGLGPGWRLADLRSLDDTDDGSEWFDTISQANDAAPQPQQVDSSEHGANGNGLINGNSTTTNDDDDDDDDDYWASYDRTPGRTPAPKQSPAPQSLSQFQPNARRQQQTAEDNYFSRYGAEVQPAMDAHDPDEEASAAQLGFTTNAPNGASNLQSQPQSTTDRPISRPTNTTLYPASTTTTTNFPDFSIPAPRPISPTSSHSSIEKLEARARAISDAQVAASEDRAQTAIKQHISTDIKSLFRLARNTGMDREDFEEIVKKELQCLSLLEGEMDR